MWLHFEVYKKLEKVRIMEAQKVEQNSRKIACLFVELERLKKWPKNGNLRPRFYAWRKHAKNLPFLDYFSTWEKIIEMVFFLNYRQHKKWPKFWIYDNIKAYLKDFFFERLCLAWKVSKENIIFIPFLGSVKLFIKGDHFWPFF